MSLINFLKSDEFLAMLKEEIAREESYKIKINRYIDKLNSLSINDRDILFNKIKEKYESDSYKDRYYKRGLMPEEYLYSIIFEYAIKYGDKIASINEYAESYKIDNKWLIHLIIGQGTIILFEKI